MARGSSVDYTPYATEQSGGGGGTPSSAHATPNDFGAQVSQQMEKTGDEAFQLAQKHQGIINETTMVNADSDFATQVGKIKGDYQSLTGMAAYAAFPKYQEDIKAAYQASRAGLPPMAQHGFDMMATRSMANHVADGSSYATSQLKEAQRDSYSSLTNSSLTALLDPDTAMDKDRSQYHLDSIKYATQAQIDEGHPGLKTDPETGTVNFDESKPEGVALKQQFQQNLDTRLSQGYINRYDTLSKLNLSSAYADYQQNRPNLPRQAQVALDASFAPKIYNAHVQTGSVTALTAAAQDHANLLYNPDRAGAAIDTVLKNEGGASPDGHAIYGIDKNAHPDEFAKASAMSPEDGQAYARQFYKQEYWDKKGIGDLPPETQKVVMDGVVNHSTEFGDKLIKAAKDGATSQQLIDMRRGEYQRLATANPDKYGANLQGWNNRLDSLQTGLAMEGHPKSFGQNEDGAPLSLADYYRTHSQEIYAKGDAYAEQQMPGDLALKRAVRQSLQNQMSQTISNESAQKTLDNRNVIKGISGGLTKGKVPETEAELRAIPGMNDLLDKVAAQDPKFAEGIPTMIEKMARRNTSTNSSNGYATIQRALEPHGNPNAINSIDHLARQLGRSDGTGISMKDYNDAAPLMEMKQPFKTMISKSMKEISVANGNLDGKGQDRAITWYNQVMEAKKQNDAKGDKAMPDSEFIKTIKDAIPYPAPSRMAQINDAAKQKSAFNYDTIQSGEQYTAPDGSIRTKR